MFQKGKFCTRQHQGQTVDEDSFNTCRWGGSNQVTRSPHPVLRAVYLEGTSGTSVCFLPIWSTLRAFVRV